MMEEPTLLSRLLEVILPIYTRSIGYSSDPRHLPPRLAFEWYVFQPAFRCFPLAAYFRRKVDQECFKRGLPNCADVSFDICHHDWILKEYREARSHVNINMPSGDEWRHCLRLQRHLQRSKETREKVVDLATILWMDLRGTHVY